MGYQSCGSTKGHCINHAIIEFDWISIKNSDLLHIV